MTKANGRFAFKSVRGEQGLLIPFYKIWNLMQYIKIEAVALVLVFPSDPIPQWDDLGRFWDRLSIAAIKVIAKIVPLCAQTVPMWDGIHLGSIPNASTPKGLSLFAYSHSFAPPRTGAAQQYPIDRISLQLLIWCVEASIFK